MLTNRELLVRLRVLGLSPDGAKLYLELLKGPRTHLELSRGTGIDRAKIYRVAEQLENRSLLTHMTDDRGTFLAASDPSNLEVDLISKEQSLEQQRKALQTVLPSLTGLQLPASSTFSFKTYSGLAGIRQMCWNELKTKDEIIVFGHGNIEALTDDRRWAAKHRSHQLDARYHNRDLVNEDNASRSTLANERLYEANLYRAGILPKSVLQFEEGHQTVVYNDTVEIFHWQEDQRVGIEIISSTYATMMRQLFDHYWTMASELSLTPRK